MSCFESSASIWAIRALIIAWVSFDTVIVPAMTWSTNSPIRSLARARCSSSRARRPCAMIWSSRLGLLGSVGAAAAGRRSGSVRRRAHLRPPRPGRRPGRSRRLSFFSDVGVVDHVLEQLLELVVAVHLVQQVRQPLAGLEELAERLDLLDDLLGLEVVDVAEPQLDVRSSSRRPGACCRPGRRAGASSPPGPC